MADIAFLLIIFFMVTINFEVDKTQVFLPKTTVRLEIPKKAAYISITESGQIRVSGGEEISVPVHPEDVLSFAADVVARDPQKEFVLKADQSVPYRYVDGVIDSLKQAKARVIYLLSEQETVESGRVVRFPAPVIDTNGESSEQEVIRVGLFNAQAQGRYLTYQTETGRFVVLARQPDQITLGNKTDGAPAIDPTRGVLLSLLVETPDLAERIQQGGVVGYVILALGALGLLIVIFRLIYLAITGRAIGQQLNNLTTPSSKNPLGRILAVANENADADPGNLELQIDEAILRELPRLTRGEGLVKLLAGVAPLLGLLGTVVGMIATFQSITLFGTGDPKMMADGISQALVTTALGLIVAIPLLFMHTLVASRSQALVQILDEQSLGLVAAGRENTDA